MSGGGCEKKLNNSTSNASKVMSRWVCVKIKGGVNLSVIYGNYLRYVLISRERQNNSSSNSSLNLNPNLGFTTRSYSDSDSTSRVHHLPTGGPPQKKIPSR